MKKYAMIFFVLMATAGYADTSEKTVNDPDRVNLDYPYFDITAGFGFLWLVQLNITISPVKYSCR